MTRQLILDTETTGFNPNTGDRMIEFAALEMIDRKLTGRSLHLYFNPERDIPESAIKVHGITNDRVAKEPVFAKRAEQIIEFIKDSELIIHNAKFDLSFMDHHFVELGFSKTNEYVHNVIDTLAIARSKFAGAKNSLDALCDRFNISREGRVYHGALIDCELLADVYIAITKEQISLLEENKTNEFKKIAQEFNQITEQFLLKEAVVSNEETQLHNKILQSLNKASNGQSAWFNASKDFISE